MAVTSLWPIKGRLDKVINYARNPEKTTEESRDDVAALHAVRNVLEYAADDIKTERRSFVTCLNCQEESAAQQFLETKRLWSEITKTDKTGGRACYHGYQSFKADEVTAEIAHEIGVKMAEELWGKEYEVVIATHCNTGHYHNHFVINTVSRTDGRKFHNTPADYARMREVSDRLCREYGISVIEHPKGKAKPYNEWKAEQEGRPTIRGTIRTDIDTAILASTNRRAFFNALTAKGYTFKLVSENGKPLKYPGLKPPGAKGFFRFNKLGQGYTLEDIDDRLLGKSTRTAPYSKKERDEVARERADNQPPYTRRVSGLHALYLRYCYELHIIEKHPTSAKRVSIFMREDLAKLDRLDAQTRFLARSGIETGEQLSEHRAGAESEIAALSEERRSLNRDIRRLSRAGDESADAIREQRDAISTRLNELRREVSLCDSIAERSARTREELERFIDEQEIEERRNRTNELLR